MLLECKVKTLRNEAVDGTLKSFLRCATEHSFSGGVEDHYVLVAVDSNDGIHGRGDDSFQAFLALAHLRFRALTVGNVSDYGKGAALAVNFNQFRRS